MPSKKSRKPLPGQLPLSPELSPPLEPEAESKPRRAAQADSTPLAKRPRLRGGLQGLYQQSNRMQRRTKERLLGEQTLGALSNAEPDTEAWNNRDNQAATPQPPRRTAPRQRQPDEKDEDPAANWRNVPSPRFSPEVLRQYREEGLAKVREALPPREPAGGSMPEAPYDEA